MRPQLINHKLLLQDYEKDTHQMNLTVTCYNPAIPNHHANMTITFLLSDINDNAPRFHEQEYSFKLKENKPYQILGNVEADDKDGVS